MSSSDKGPYSRVYQAIVDDPMFERVFNDDAALGTWLRMLMIADAMWPATAPLPRRNLKVTLLIASGLVEERPNNRYTIRGLEAERERRSASARIAAAVRWHNARSADAMPRRDEKNKEETSKDAIASTERPAAFMGFRQRLQPSLASVQAQHDRDFDACAQCGQRRGGPAHAPGKATHPFQEDPA